MCNVRMHGIQGAVRDIFYTTNLTASKAETAAFAMRSGTDMDVLLMLLHNGFYAAFGEQVGKRCVGLVTI